MSAARCTCAGSTELPCWWCEQHPPLPRPCPTCKGNGRVVGLGREGGCGACEGTGCTMHPKEVDYSTGAIAVAEERAYRRGYEAACAALGEVYASLGWQGGTIHQIVAEVRRLKAIERAAQSVTAEYQQSFNRLIFRIPGDDSDVIMTEPLASLVVALKGK